MAARRSTAAERSREAKEEAQRNARRGLRAGVLGIVVLFLSGLGAFLWTGYILGFVGGMVVGILLLLAAFLLMRGSVLVFKPQDETKIY